MSHYIHATLHVMVETGRKPPKGLHMNTQKTEHEAPTRRTIPFLFKAIARILRSGTIDAEMLDHTHDQLEAIYESLGGKQALRSARQEARERDWLNPARRERGFHGEHRRCKHNHAEHRRGHHGQHPHGEHRHDEHRHGEHRHGEHPRGWRGGRRHDEPGHHDQRGFRGEHRGRHSSQHSGCEHRDGGGMRHRER